jgi:hypothetical protein
LQRYIYERRIFGKIFPLCFLCSLLFKIFGCGLPRCVMASWRLCVEILAPDCMDKPSAVGNFWFALKPLKQLLQLIG